MSRGQVKDRKAVCSSPPADGALKLNVDGAAKSKPGPTGIR